ncbi:M23 family metallopeptidase [Aeromicrobium sp. Leaf350]|uniref:M23 family metallopeptidase n=1 Tax=Aeromicrobium sp. Leaf350 TaxID=2876565 RepID=UPI001E650250|nr:M23 family metallopeptidase [Aeromicrobium sp. Leaf350]
MIAGLRPLWDALMLLLAALLVADVLTAVLPGLSGLGLPGGALGALVVYGVPFVVLSLLVGVAPRHDLDVQEPVELAPPVRGRWVSVNGPGQQLPSHGTRTRGQYGAIDVCGTSGPTTPEIVRWALRSSRPEAYPCFGEPIHAMAGGTVVRVRDGQRDHRARNTWQGFAYMFTFEALWREAAGTGRVLGNHVVVDHGDGTFAAYAHLKKGSARVGEGDRLEVGDVLGSVGNTGNSSMPHLHVQLMDRASVDAAAGVVMRWRDIELTGELDEQLESFGKDPSDSAVKGMPRNAETFVARDPA